MNIRHQLDLPIDLEHAKAAVCDFYNFLPGTIGPQGFPRKSFYELEAYGDNMIGLRKTRYLEGGHVATAPWAHYADVIIHFFELAVQRTRVRIECHGDEDNLADEVAEALRAAYLTLDKPSSGALREQEIQSLQWQLNEARENLRLTEERQAKYVQETDIPLQLIKDERRLKEQVAELEKKLSSQ